MPESVLESTGIPGADGRGASVGIHSGTGGPGGTGGQGLTPPKLSLVKSESTTVAELHEQVRNERIVMFRGLTGAPGLEGDIKVNEQGELDKPVSMDAEEKLNRSLLDKIESMGLDELQAVINSQNNALCAALANVQASNGNRGYTIGKALIRAKYLADSANFKKGFEAWHRENMDPRTLSLRTCQKFMDIARTPGVLNWLVLGTEKLAALKPILQGISDLDEKDPISDFMKRCGIDPKSHTDVEDLRFEIGVGMAMAKLKSSEVHVSRKMVYDFLAKGFDLKVKDIAVMKEAQDSGGSAAKYLERLIKNGQRPKVMKVKEITVDNFHEQAQMLVDLIDKLLGAPRIKGDIQITRIDTLKERLGALEARITQDQSAK